MLTKIRRYSKVLWATCLLALVAGALYWYSTTTPDEQTPSQNTTAANATQVLPLNAHTTTAYTDDLPGLIERRYIRVLTTVNRTNFFIADGHFVGYEYALLKGYQQYLNNHIDKGGLKIVLEFFPVARDELIPKLRNGYGDIAAAGLSITPERQEKVDFTTPYLTGINEVVVTHTASPRLQSLADLSGEKVYVRESSSYFQSLEKLNTRLQKNGTQPVRIKTLSENLETESILEMVNSGALGITVADSHIAEAWAKVLPEIHIHEDLVLRQGAKIAWMVRQNNPELKQSVNSYLQNHKKGTLLGNIYFNRYYQNAPKLKNPVELEKWSKVKQYKDVIQKYARQYDFDWLLILAIAFQESGFDNSKTSHAGAVGLMQILPSTAQDPKIDIPNVRKAENNVHAGVKYLRFLIDRYYSSEDIRRRDQIRFALAAYNAGPAKIRKVRQLAQEMGLDKNRWFRNVELAALRIIGQETVRYVSNINKYYVLYQTMTSE
ncbi:MAG: transglycosylase SLT domain-containing protein [Thermodesulfobacteriota bacterium]